MSTLLRAILFVVAWLVFAFTTFTFCIEPVCCGDEIAVVGDPDTDPDVLPPPDSNYAVVSRLNDPEVIKGELWPEVRAKLLADYAAKPDQELSIYGNFYPDEPVPEGYENMGFYRAEQIRAMVVPDIPEDKIRPLAHRMDGEIPPADQLWKAGTFSLNSTDTPDPVVELDDEVIVRFPFGVDTKEEVSPTVVEYLDKLAVRLEKTEETVTIIGNTDNIGSEPYNLALGQRRADFMEEMLIKRGVSADRITTRSEGETNPVDTNETAAGRSNNRRAVVRLNKQQ